MKNPKRFKRFKTKRKPNQDNWFSCTKGHFGDEGFYGLYPLSVRDAFLCDFKQFDAWVILDSLGLNAVKILDTREFPVLFVNIRDGDAPTKEEVDRIIDFAENYDKVLISCIGAHGRTGTILAIWIHLKDPTQEDPILRVKRVYCKKAVETMKQAEFIYKYLGLKPNKEVLKDFQIRRFNLWNSWNSWDRSW